MHVLSGEDEGSPVPLPPTVDDPYWSAISEVTLKSWLSQWETYQSECLEQLQKFTAEAHQLNINAEFRQVPGSPGRIICHLASSWAKTSEADSFASFSPNRQNYCQKEV